MRPWQARKEKSQYIIIIIIMLCFIILSSSIEDCHFSLWDSLLQSIKYVGFYFYFLWDRMFCKGFETSNCTTNCTTVRCAIHCAIPSPSQCWILFRCCYKNVHIGIVSHHTPQKYEADTNDLYTIEISHMVYLMNGCEMIYYQTLFTQLQFLKEIPSTNIRRGNLKRITAVHWPFNHSVECFPWGQLVVESISDHCMSRAWKGQNEVSWPI